MPEWFQQVPDLLTVLLDEGLPWITAYGLWAVTLGLLTETLLFTGLIVPGYGILVAAGYLVSGEHLPAVVTVGCAWAGAVVGDIASYYLGWLWGDVLLRRRHRAVLALRGALQRQGAWLLLGYHYAPPLRALLPCVLGSTRVPIRRWLGWDAVGVLVWALTAMAIGYCAHGALYAGGNMLAMVVNLLATVLAIGITWRVTREFRLQRAEAEGEEVAGPPTQA